MKIKLSDIQYREDSHPGYLQALVDRGRVYNGVIEISLPDYVDINNRDDIFSILYVR